MVNREVDSTSPRSPLSYRELLAAIPPTLPNQTPSAPPAGFRVFGQFPPRYSACMTAVFGGGSQFASEAGRRAASSSDPGTSNSKAPLPKGAPNVIGAALPRRVV